MSLFSHLSFDSKIISWMFSIAIMQTKAFFIEKLRAISFIYHFCTPCKCCWCRQNAALNAKTLTKETCPKLFHRKSRSSKTSRPFHRFSLQILSKWKQAETCWCRWRLTMHRWVGLTKLSLTFRWQNFHSWTVNGWRKASRDPRTELFAFHKFAARDASTRFGSRKERSLRHACSQPLHSHSIPLWPICISRAENWKSCKASQVGGRFNFVPFVHQLSYCCSASAYRKTDFACVEKESRICHRGVSHSKASIPHHPHLHDQTKD